MIELLFAVLVTSVNSACAGNHSVVRDINSRSPQEVASGRLLAIGRVFGIQGHLKQIHSMYRTALMSDSARTAARDRIALLNL